MVLCGITAVRQDCIITSHGGHDIESPVKIFLLLPALPSTALSICVLSMSRNPDVLRCMRCV